MKKNCEMLIEGGVGWEQEKTMMVGRWGIFGTNAGEKTWKNDRKDGGNGGKTCCKTESVMRT